MLVFNEPVRGQADRPLNDPLADTFGKQIMDEAMGRFAVLRPRPLYPGHRCHLVIKKPRHISVKVTGHGPQHSASRSVRLRGSGELPWPSFALPLLGGNPHKRAIANSRSIATGGRIV